MIGTRILSLFVMTAPLLSMANEWHLFSKFIVYFEKVYDTLEDVEYMLQRHKVNQFVTLHKRDAFTVHEDYDDHSVCFLHVDLSNDGEVLRKIVERWDDKLSFGGLLLFEGGSEERDNVAWMQKYNKAPIKDEIESYLLIDEINYAKERLRYLLRNALMEADEILLAGEAGSHCLANTGRDIADAFGDDSYVEKITLLEDATSPVAGFENFQSNFISEMVARGMKMSKTTDF